ncbi:MAG TPA: hypothetical protein VIK26_06510 [Clostridium sp.]
MNGISWKLIYEQFRNIYTVFADSDMARLVTLPGCSRTYEL